MKIPFLILLFIIFNHFLFAQAEINQLTVERAVHYQKYKEAENLTSGIFGNRSKDDLQLTIDALNEIIKKDNEILEGLTNIQENSKIEFTNKYNDLILQNNELSQKNSALLEMTEKHNGYTKENHLMIEETQQKQNILMSLLLSFGLLFVIYITKYFMLKSKTKTVRNRIQA